jgi:hypothetical protein
MASSSTSTSNVPRRLASTKRRSLGFGQRRCVARPTGLRLRRKRRRELREKLSELKKRLN